MPKFDMLIKVWYRFMRVGNIVALHGRQQLLWPTNDLS
jgi:hypothetical protein